MTKTPRLLALLVAGLAGTQSVFAQAPAKETPPAPAPPRDFAVPAPKTFVLDNGLAVTLVNYGNTPKVDVGVYVAAGNSYEKPTEVWLGDLTAQLMREGTVTKTGAQISKAAAGMGGRVEVSVGTDTASVSGSSLSEFAADLVKLVADVTLNPKFPASELERLKTDNLRRLSIAKSNPQQMAVEKFRAVVYGNHPYGRIFPTEAQMKGYTLAQAKAFYDAHWAASRARLYVAGRFDMPAVEASIRAAFSGWKKGAMSHPPAPKPRAERAVHIVDKPGAVQTTLIVGLPTIDASQKDAIPLSVTNTVLGGYFSSRMTANLRESKGYTYSPFSQVSNRYRDASWAQNADVSTAVTGASLKEIFYEIDRLQGEAPTEAELDSAKNYMLGTFVLRNSDRFGIINQLEFIDFHGLPADYLNTYVGKVRDVTPAVVQEVTKKYLDDTKTAIIAVGDRKAIEEQVKPYGATGGEPAAQNPSRNPRPCEADANFRKFDFWVGEWDVQPTGAPRAPVGASSDVEKILSGCVIFENWEPGPGKGGAGKSFNIYNTSTKKWEQYWVDASGRITHYFGEFREDGNLYYEADQFGTPSKLRMTFFNQGPDQVRQLGHLSTDGGKTWTVSFDLTYVRKK